ncbi:hypothetical protein [Streptomyces sp. NPDC001068]|uniref:hypothetical protein n=1 Tax=Streptomyces sp. NPDC001068 TaxID=3364544 RepID=UPI003677FB64
MGRGRFTGTLVTAAVALLLAGCSPSSSGAPAGGARPTGGGTPSGYGARFLAAGECSSFGTAGFTEVPCTGERAAARVVARHDGTIAAGPPCPATTDFVLHIGAQRTGGGPGGGGRVPRGYACMRSLEPPHPGDPGGGGGPRTIVGDCLYGSGRGRVRETACDGSGRREPRYRVVRAVTARDRCPASTALYVRLGGDRPVGCARRVRTAGQGLSTGSSPNSPTSGPPRP